MGVDGLLGLPEHGLGGDPLAALLCGIPAGEGMAALFRRVGTQVWQSAVEGCGDDTARAIGHHPRIDGVQGDPALLLQHLNAHRFRIRRGGLDTRQGGQGVGHPAEVVPHPRRVGGRGVLVEGGAEDGLRLRLVAFIAVPLIGEDAAVGYRGGDVEGVGSVALGVDVPALRQHRGSGRLRGEVLVLGHPHLHLGVCGRHGLPGGVHGALQGDGHVIFPRLRVLVHIVPQGDDSLLRGDVLLHGVVHHQAEGVGTPVVMEGEALLGENAAHGVAHQVEGSAVRIVQLGQKSPKAGVVLQP